MPLLQLFPLWALLISVFAYFQSGIFIGLQSQVVPLLSIIMLCMGLTLKFTDFRNTLKLGNAMTIGILLQFTVMPVAAWLIAKLFSFDVGLTVGLLLVGSVAGGTASNVMCYLAKGNVALSITMTTASTLISVVLTPFLIAMLAGESVDVPIQGMLVSLIQVVIIPVGLGAIVNVYLCRILQKIEIALPFISMVSILLIIAIVVSLNANKIASMGIGVVLAVMLHNVVGLTFGYSITALMGFNSKTCRTIAFEVGLQNSGLATALAVKFFTPSAALPGAVFSVWHNISGSILAGYWSNKNLKDEESRASASKTLQ